MQNDDLSAYLDSLKRDECYRVDAVLKESAHETTQKVYFVGLNGSEQGPFVRKYIRREAGLGAVYRLIFEAQRSGRRFRSIPAIVDCYDSGDTFVVVMEYVRGETLADVVGRCGAGRMLALDVFPRLCDAVSELHEGFDRPIIHRDLKPSNVMLSRGGLVIVDFGIARMHRDDAKPDTVRFGTRAYAPPEQFGYRQTDVRSDEYALGMLLYFCLTGKTPDACVREQGFDDPAVSPPVREVLLRATAFDPDDRYASAAELKRAFLDAVGGQSDGGQAGRRDGRFEVAQTRRPAVSIERIPLWIGLAWDAFLLLLLVLMGASGIQQVVLHPTGEAASYPMWYNAFMYIGIMAMLASFMLPLVDKRLLARRFGAVRRVQGARGALAGVASGVACFVIVVIVGVFATSFS